MEGASLCARVNDEMSLVDDFELADVALEKAFLDAAGPLRGLSAFVLISLRVRRRSHRQHAKAQDAKSHGASSIARFTVGQYRHGCPRQAQGESDAFIEP